MSIPRIYVAIPALNEPEMVHLTINNALAQAEHPERVYFGVAYHFSDGSPEKIYLPRTETIRIMHETGLGVSMTRVIANSLHSGQEYILQIDAHMLFQKNWDSLLIDYYKKIKKQTDKKVVITQYPQKFERDAEKNILGYPEGGNIEGLEKGIKGTPAGWKKPALMDIDIPRENNSMPLTEEENAFFRENGYVEHLFTHASFIFSEPDFQTEVPPYPLYYYADEQPLLTLRGWTRGYRFYTIKDPILWGYNKPSDPNLPKDDRYRIEQRILNNEIDQLTSPEGIYKVRETMGHKEAVAFFYGRAFGIGGAPSREPWEEYMATLSARWV